MQADVKEGGTRAAIDNHLAKIQYLASQSCKDAQRLVTAGAVPTLIHLLKTRAADSIGLDIVLITLGTIAYVHSCHQPHVLTDPGYSHDSISANTVYRTNTVLTLIEIFSSTSYPEVATLSLWCINRICRTPEVASGLIKRGLVGLLISKGLRGERATPTMSAYCMGTLAQSDSLAEAIADQGAVVAISDHLRSASESTDSISPEDICAGSYAVARISRTISLAKAFAKAGCVDVLAHQLNRSEDPEILQWTARAVGCLMRPNSNDMSKILLAAGIAKGLARLPSVLPTEEVAPLASFAFAIQRLSCAEWGGGTRKALVEAGVVDSLLAAMRTAVDEPYPQVHIELALAASFLGDVGGSAIRKEIVNAGGIDILKRVGAIGSPEVSKACNMAVTSITGNLWSRNAGTYSPLYKHPCV